MNSRDQAKKGFKTFLLTLIISLVIFSGIYYVINSQNDEEFSGNLSKTEEPVDVLSSKSAQDKTKTLGAADNRDEESVFADLAGQKMDESGNRAVLAGTDSVDTTDTVVTTVTTEPTVDTTVTTTTTTTTATADAETTDTETAQTTVPDTGVSGPTMGVVLTLIILGFAAYIMFLGPRNVALHNFEKDFLDDLE